MENVKKNKNNSPFSVKLVHALQRLNKLQDLIPLPIKHQLPETEPDL